MDRIRPKSVHWEKTACGWWGRERFLRERASKEVNDSLDKIRSEPRLAWMGISGGDKRGRARQTDPAMGPQQEPAREGRMVEKKKKEKQKKKKKKKKETHEN